MKCSWIGKKQSLFKLGSYAFLVVILVIAVGFVVSRLMVGRNSAGSNLAVTPGLPSALNISHTAQRSGATGPFSQSKVSLNVVPGAASAPSNTGADASGSGQGGASAPESQSSDIGPQYLVKTLNVDLNVKDTRKVADSLLAWITTTDPRATTSTTDYEQVGDNLYDVSLTFSVQATRYPLIYRYLRDYTVHNGGRLVTFNESVQDVTDTYVDTQSRLQNLRVEQGRLQDLVSHAQDLSDILSIDQQLTDVEGQIESDEAQLNTLTSQVTFYTVSVSLEPIDTAAPPPSNNNGWSVGRIFRDAFSASLAFGQGVLTLLIWLLAFGLYVVPLATVVWLGRKWYVRTRRASLPKVATNDAIPVYEEVVEASDIVNEDATTDAVPVNE